MSVSPTIVRGDWAAPRTSAAFTGYVGQPSKEGPGNPSGTLLLCVANTPIPCKSEGMASQKSIQFTVLNIRKKGWICAPWKKPAKNAKTIPDENRKELFENGEWARNDVTMERVGQSVVMYSFLKDGQARGERVDDAVSVIASGQTFRVRLQEFMYEDKKGGVNVFPSDLDVIPAFSVVEIMVNPANHGGFEQGYGMQLIRARPCEFSLYSMHDPLGLYLLPGTYEQSVVASETAIQKSQGLRKVIEEKNTGFFGKVTKGAYIMKYNEDFRLVGPKETPNDPQSRHVNVMDGSSVFAVDIRKEDLLRFANSGEASEEDGIIYAQFMVDFASAAGALDCYVTCNEYLLRNDPNRSPFTGVPLIDSERLLDFIKTDDITGKPGQRFRLPFDFFPMDQPYLSLTPIPEAPENHEDGVARPCSDFSLTSTNALSSSERTYLLTLGDATDDDVMSFVFIPKGASSAGGVGGVKLLGRQDYRMLKRRRIEE